MITISNTDIHGIDAAVRAMRNPMNSWALSDSTHMVTSLEEYRAGYKVGKNDLDLMQRLVRSGDDHAKFMRFIVVTCDIIAPMYWWKEFDTYKVGTVRLSCSTMHKIHSKEFTESDFSMEHLITEDRQSVKERLTYVSPMFTFRAVIEQLNFYRNLFIKTNDKLYWWQMIQLLPSSYNQRATVQLNYQVLRNIYAARKAHKLDEWRKFCR